MPQHWFDTGTANSLVACPYSHIHVTHLSRSIEMPIATAAAQNCDLPPSVQTYSKLYKSIQHIQIYSIGSCVKLDNLRDKNPDKLMIIRRTTQNLRGNGLWWVLYRFNANGRSHWAAVANSRYLKNAAVILRKHQTPYRRFTVLPPLSRCTPEHQCHLTCHES